MVNEKRGECLESLTPQQAAEFLGVSTRTLQRWRTSGEGPRFTQRRQVVRYARRALEEWLEGGV